MLYDFASNSMDLKVLGQFFDFLNFIGYQWRPQTPDQLIKSRKNAEKFSETTKLFGLGIEVDIEKLFEEWSSYPHLDSLVDNLLEKKFIKKSNTHFQSIFAISGNSGQYYVVHDHWPPSVELSASANYIHVGLESAQLIEKITPKLEEFRQKYILDLGCSSGVLCFEFARTAHQILGIDISSRAVFWAKLISEVYGFKNLKFECGAIGSDAIHQKVTDAFFDLAIMNPPMVIADPSQKNPHRDGGELGIEIPLLFLDFAYKKLKSGGKVFCMMTNPIVKGRSLLFDELKKRKFKITNQEVLHSHFNQNLHRKHKYDQKNIDHIELLYLEFTK